MTDCIFCRIAAGDISADVVKRTDQAVAIRDLDPRAPTHVLVIPVQHVVAVRDLTGAEGERTLGRLFAFAAEVAHEMGLDAGGYRLVTNTGDDAGQSVHHLHIHVLGGRRFAWPPG